MPVSKHRQKKHRGTRKAQQPKPGGMVFMRHPFSTLPRDEILKGLLEVGKTHQDEFPNQLTSVTAILKSVDPLLTLSMLSTYGLTCSIDDSGHIRSGYKGDEFNQSHVELAQALCLSIPFEDCSQEFPTPGTIQQLFDLLPELSNAFHLQRFIQMDKNRSDEDKAVLVIQEELRLHTQVVRNWGYLSKVASIVNRLSSPINEVFLSTTGISATNLIDLFSHLIRRHERRFNERLAKLRPVFSQPTIAEMLVAYHNANPQLKDSSAEMIASAKVHGVTIEQMKFLLLSHSDLSLDETYIFNADALAKETGIDATSITSALDYLSLNLGALARSNPEHFFLANPVWTKPVIKISKDQYFCAMPQVFFSFVFPILSELLENDRSAMSQYENRRAVFLESEVSSLFQKAFPDCEISSNYRWREGADEYENDLMVRIDSHLIVVEAKSHSISWPALRGAPDRARRHFKEMLLDPSLQSLRLATRITQALSAKDNWNALLPNFPIALDQVRTVLRLSVTLEDFATLQTTLHHAKEANWIPPEHPIAPCILLADLEIVFDILESTPHKIHYLKRRADLEANLNYKGDELDLLGVYLQTGFNIGEAEFSGDHFALVAMSKLIDNYYMALEEGVVTPKPAPKMTRWWKDICAKIEKRDFHQWSDIANVLLSVSFEDQEIIATKFKKIVKNVHKNWRTPNHNCAIIMTPSKEHADALAVFAFKENDKNERYTRMENVASQVFEASHLERCLVIGINIDKMHYPYSLIGVYFKPSE